MIMLCSIAGCRDVAQTIFYGFSLCGHCFGYAAGFSVETLAYQTAIEGRLKSRHRDKSCEESLGGVPMEVAWRQWVRDEVIGGRGG